MCIRDSSEHKEAAEMFINFMCETDIGKANSEYIGYTTPMHDVWEVLDEDLKTSEIAYPSEEDAAREKVFTALSDEVNSELDLKWSEMKSYDEGGGSYLFLLLLLAMLALASSISGARCAERPAISIDRSTKAAVPDVVRRPFSDRRERLWNSFIMKAPPW